MAINTRKVIVGGVAAGVVVDVDLVDPDAEAPSPVVRACFPS